MTWAEHQRHEGHCSPSSPPQPDQAERWIGFEVEEPQADLRFLWVEPAGLEPATPCLQSRCATNCAKAPRGGAVQDRLTESVASAQRAWSARLSSIRLRATRAPAAARARRRTFFTWA